MPRLIAALSILTVLTGCVYDPSRVDWDQVNRSAAMTNPNYRPGAVTCSTSDTSNPVTTCR